MDGLECSEIMLKEQSFHARIDAEFFSKKNLFLQERLNASGAYPMKKYGALLDCSAFYPSITEYYSHDRSLIPFLRVNEIQNGLISITDGTVFLPEEILAANKKTIAIAYPGDIIIAKGGNTLAKVGLVTEEYPRYATCRDVIILRTNNLKNLNKYYLWAFLHSSYGQGILWRSASQTGQPHLTLPSILEIRIPDINTIQNDIESIYIKSVEKKHQAESLYDAAQQQLLNELQFVSSSASERNIAEKKLSDSFELSGRLDAEYYQPKYEEYFKILHTFNTTNIPTEYEVFKNSGTNYSENVSDVGVIKTKQLGNDEINIDGIESYFDIQSCIENKSTFIVKRDVLFASMGVGSLGKVSIFSYDGNRKYVTDSTLRIYRAKSTCRVLPEVLCVFLQSFIGQELIYRYVVGSTGIINIYDDDMAKIPIPILDDEIQSEIASKVQKSIILRKQYKQLLNYAKQAVEMAIEKGEAVATKWLKENVELLEG